MYFPYVRGRQYELLALRELVSSNLLGDFVLPVIEPVKLSPTLVKTIGEFIQKDHPLAVIGNPMVGSFLNDYESVREDSREGSYREDFVRFCENSLIVKSVIMKEDALPILASWEKTGIRKEDLLAVNINRDSLTLFDAEFSGVYPRYAFVPDERACLRGVKHNRVIWEDRFEKQSRNADYQENEDEFFSDDHVYFREERFVGFSDYSVIGNEYQEGGFAPYAVAIHIVYFAEDESLRIKHFVSDSNEDITNPAKKFYQAVEKLYEWYHANPFPPTVGLSLLLQHYEGQTYPGLGSVKKLSIMHHLELMGKYLAAIT